MIGKLTFDKSSKDLNLFLFSIYIIGRYGTAYGIYRNFHDPSFVEIMGEHTGSSPYKFKDGKIIEERTLYNKSLYAQYYGFIDRSLDVDHKEVMHLTKRGKILFSYIQYDEDNKHCYLSPSGQRVLQDLIWDSIMYDSFGSFNDGAQTSSTDIDAPKVIFRTIFDLAGATNEEIFYILFSLNRGDCGELPLCTTYPLLKQEILHNRERGLYDYNSFFSQYHLLNKVNDSKLIDILSDPQLELLAKEERNGIVFNILSPSCNRFLKDRNRFECWYNPHNLVLSTRSIQLTTEWLSYTILNNNENKMLPIFITLDEVSEESFRASLELIVKKATNDGRRVTLVITCKNEDVLTHYLGDYITLLKRVDNYLDAKHGYSEKSITGLHGDSIRFPNSFNFVSLLNDK